MAKAVPSAPAGEIKPFDPNELDNSIFDLSARYRAMEKLLVDWYWEQGPEFGRTDLAAAINLSDLVRESLDKVLDMMDARDGIPAK
ncbi:MAG: hypothetical protein KDA53_12745 [Hyphomonas sp.]|nr:hypothetical protein [Hyphomonas sp.]